MSSISINAKERFTNLRKKLDQLGYMQPLSVDSLPLVESVFTDLIWTTDSFRKCKIELEKRIEVRERLEEYVEPYKKDNGRLVNENNRLQKKILELKIENDEQSRDLQCRIRQLEDEREDVRAFSEQCLCKLKKYEVDAKEMIDKIVELQDRSMQAVIHTPDGKRKSVPFLRQRMDIDYFIPNSNKSNIRDCLDEDEEEIRSNRRYNHRIRTPDNAEQLNLLDCVTNKCQQLTTQLQRAHEELELNDRKIDGYTNQLQLYEDEIQRLARELSGGRSLEALSAETEHKSRDRLIEQLNIQLDLLQQRNEELERELIKLNALNIKEGKSGRCKENKNKIPDYSPSDLEDQNKKLMKKIECLVEREKSLLKELHCSNKLVNQRDSDCIPIATAGLEQEIEALRQHVSSLEEDRNYWKHEAETCGIVDKQQRDSVKSRSQQKEKGERHFNESLNELKEDLVDCRRQMKEVALENEELKDLINNLERQQSPPVQDRDPTRDLQGELRKVKMERDNLQELLNKFERQVHDIQGNVKVLTHERDAINERYQDCKQEMQELRAALIDTQSSGRSSHGSMGATAVLRRLEMERDQVMTDLHQMTTERDSLRERLHSCTESALNDKSRLTQRLEDQEREHQRMLSETDDMHERLRTLRLQLGQLEERNRSLMERNNSLKETLDKERSTLQEMSSQLHQYDNELQQRSQQVDNSQQQLADAEKTIRDLQTHSDTLNKNNKKLESELSRLQRIIEQLDEEKDQMQTGLDDKSEDMKELDQKLRVKESALDEIRVHMTGLEQQLRRIQDVNDHRDHELRAVMLHNEQLESDLRQQVAKNDELKGRLGQIEQDVLKVNREKQVLENDYRKCQRFTDDLKMEKEQLENKLDQLERFGCDQQKQNDEVFQQYRQLNLENERLQTQLQQSQKNLDQLQQDLVTRETVVSNMREQLFEAEEQVGQSNIQIKQLEGQIQNLSRLVDSNQHVLDTHSKEKREILQELAAMRDLCSRLETGKDHLQSQLSTKLLDIEQLKSENSELCQDNERMREQLSELQNNLTDMETVMSAGREKEFRTQMSAQQRMAEMEAQLEQMSQLKCQFDRISRDVAKWKSRSQELEAESDRLRRQLTSEKFKLEMANQELRRRKVSVAPSAPPRSNTSTPTDDHLPPTARHEHYRPSSARNTEMISSHCHDDNDGTKSARDGTPNSYQGFYHDTYTQENSSELRTADSNKHIRDHSEFSEAGFYPEVKVNKTINLDYPSVQLTNSMNSSNDPTLSSTGFVTNNSNQTSTTNTDDNVIVNECDHGCLHSRNCGSLLSLARRSRISNCNQNCRHSSDCLLVHKNEFQQKKKKSIPPPSSSSSSSSSSNVVQFNNDNNQFDRVEKNKVKIHTNPRCPYSKLHTDKLSTINSSVVNEGSEPRNNNPETIMANEEEQDDDRIINLVTTYNNTTTLAQIPSLLPDSLDGNGHGDIGDISALNIDTNPEKISGLLTGETVDPDTTDVSQSLEQSYAIDSSSGVHTGRSMSQRSSSSISSTIVNVNTLPNDNSRDLASQVAHQPTSNSNANVDSGDKGNGVVDADDAEDDYSGEL